ncbi:MAG: hypothetical protein U5L45_12750 [Saprospiraceae bacterium]|nr:hypothetical protein [Saprospiraceae bacterium]
MKFEIFEMLLDISYKPQADKNVVQAAFINSSDPRVWLTELSRWGKAAADWACYAVPESMHSVAPSGLFVVTEKAGLTTLSPHLMWFNRVGARLYLPVNAELTPSVSDAELDKRGVASPGSSLSMNSTDFNLGQIGGGHAVDGWSSGKHYSGAREAS